ncbi:lipid droplet-associated protein [Mycolicibacterium sp. HK-90]|uniref:lipid droplet-associated protein n=1 Tax=Mycolicibacterium sp. HK-90 TaxID=3056937 RepID=UPI002658CDE7|nr:lipid droplet-associated protein [Mycolicibacterium sp. HK-90]WKG02182.1 lipid droplet-associated protein [Mycolicibacterium sp. HK-90]
MGTAPYGVRLLVGAAVTALEETRRLPQTILTYPMTVASQAANIVMHVQQNLAELVVKGDETLEQLFPPKDEQPEWATFDEDLESDDADDTPDDTAAADGERRTEGRFALYSTGEPEAAGATNGKADRSTTGQAPEIAGDLGYDTLTLAQLRARLTSLRVADLEALLAYEEAGRARAPFVTLLANRITRATAK